MNSQRRPSLKSVFFWLTLMVLIVLTAGTSRLTQRIDWLKEARNFEVVEDTVLTTGVGPEAERLGGQVRDHRAVIALPFVWEGAHDNRLKRFRFTLDISGYVAPQDGCCTAGQRSPAKSLLISQAINGMDVYLNGVWIAGLPKSDVRGSYRWQRPLLAPLARRLLRDDGPNIVTIESTTWDPHILVPPIYVGDTASLGTIHELTTFIGWSLAQASNVFCLLAGMFLVGAWLASPRDGVVFAHAGITTVMWSLLYWLVLLPYVPANLLESWVWARYACLGGVVAVLTLFLHTFIGQPLGVRGRLILMIAASSASLASPFVGETGRVWLDHYWLPLLLLFHLHACARLLLHAVRTRSRPAMSLLFQSVLAQVFALHDHNVTVQVVRFTPVESGWSLSDLLVAPIYLSHLSVPLLLFVVAQILLTTFQANVRRIRDNNRILTETLQQRERELLVSHSRQREMEAEAAAQGERDRIYRDLHDGIGSKLITTLFSVRDRAINHERLEVQLMDALRDLREIISVTDPQEQRSIQDVLFTFCAHLDESLGRAEFSVEFDIEEGHEVVLLADQSKQIMRIVEESVANTIKYAGASRLRLSLRVDGLSMTVLIEDNGHGGHGGQGGQGATAQAAAPVRSPLSGGSGLAGMRRRAERLGATFEFQRRAEGAVTRLSLPLLGASTAGDPVRESVEHGSRSLVALKPQA